MTNESLKNAFQRFWEHVVSLSNDKANKTDLTSHINDVDNPHNITIEQIGADPVGSADTALAEAKEYTDTKVADLVNSAPETLDTLGELATAFEENKDVVEALDAAISNKQDKDVVATITTEIDMDTFASIYHCDKTFSELWTAHENGINVKVSYYNTWTADAKFEIVTTSTGEEKRIIVEYLSDNVLKRYTIKEDDSVSLVNKRFITENVLSQNTGENSALVMSQKAVTDALETKQDKNMIVTITSTTAEDGTVTYNADKTFEEIKSAINNEVNVFVKSNGVTYNLLKSTNSNIQFTSYTPSTMLYQKIVIKNDNVVTYSATNIVATENMYGGVKADAATETDTVPAKIGTDGKLYVPTYPEIPEQIQADWEQNDSTASDYIKNRIAYDEPIAPFTPIGELNNDISALETNVSILAQDWSNLNTAGLKATVNPDTLCDTFATNNTYYAQYNCILKYQLYNSYLDVFSMNEQILNMSNKYSYIDDSNFEYQVNNYLRVVFILDTSLLDEVNLALYPTAGLYLITTNTTSYNYFEAKVVTSMHTLPERLTHKLIARTSWVEDRIQSLKNDIPTIDTEISAESENPVQNKVVKEYVDTTIDSIPANALIKPLSAIGENDGITFANNIPNVVALTITSVANCNNIVYKNDIEGVTTLSLLIKSNTSGSFIKRTFLYENDFITINNVNNAEYSNTLFIGTNRVMFVCQYDENGNFISVTSRDLILSSEVLDKANENSKSQSYYPTADTDMATKGYVDSHIPTNEEVIDLLTETGFISPATTASGDIYTDSDGDVYVM